MVWDLFPCVLSMNSTPACAKAALGHIRTWSRRAPQLPSKWFPCSFPKPQKQECGHQVESNSASAIAAAGPLISSFEHATGRTLDRSTPHIYSQTSFYLPSCSAHLSLLKLGIPLKVYNTYMLNPCSKQLTLPGTPLPAFSFVFSIFSNMLSPFFLPPIYAHLSINF